MIDFDCLQFRRWLDEGGASAAGDGPPGTAPDAARRHAAGCPACGGELASARAVERLLGRGPVAVAPAASPGFVDRVLAAVALTPQDGRTPFPGASRPEPAPSPVPGDGLAWWVRAAAQPSTALACALAGTAILLAPRLDDAARLAPGWGAAAAAALAAGLAPWSEPLAAWAAREPAFGPALAFALLPPVILAAQAAYRLGLGLAAPRSALTRAGLR